MSMVAVKAVLTSGQEVRTDEEQKYKCTHTYVAVCVGLQHYYLQEGLFRFDGTKTAGGAAVPFKHFRIQDAVSWTVS